MTELENFKVWSGRPKPVVDLHVYRCIGEPHQRECADEIKTSMRERLLALNRLRLSVKERQATCHRKGRARGAPAQFQLAKASEAAIYNENLDKYVDRAAAGSSA